MAAELVDVSCIISFLAAVFSFGGGGDEALARQLESASHLPVVVMATGRAPWRPTTFDYHDSKGLARALRGRLQVEIEPDSGGVGPTSWPKGFFFKLWPKVEYEEKFRVSQKAKLELVDGRVKLADSADGVVSLQWLETKLGDVQLSWNPYFESARFTIVGRDTTPSQLVATVAEALGSDVLKEGNRYTLALNAKTFRRRTKAMCASGSAEKNPQLRAIELADLTYLDCLVTYLKDSQIKKFYGGWEGVVTFNPGHPVHVAAMKRARVLAVSLTPSKALRVSSDVPEWVAKIDESSLVRTRLRPDGTICCSYFVGDNTWYTL